MRVKHPIWLFGLGGVVLAFVLLNAYLFWLSTMIIPFESPLDLTAPDSSYDFRISGFYSDKYVCMVEFKIPQSDRSGWKNRMDKMEKAVDRIRKDLAVELHISLRDGQGTEVLVHRGTLDDWTLTNGTFSKESDAALYKYSFDARLFEAYRLQVKIIRGNEGSKRYEPRILFHGIDDGYFSTVWFLYNIIFAGGVLMLLVAIWVGGRVRRWVGKRVPSDTE